MWTLADLKIYCLNVTCFTVSLTDINSILKLVMLTTVIGYTIYKWRKSTKDE